MPMERYRGEGAFESLNVLLLLLYAEYRHCSGECYYCLNEIHPSEGVCVRA